MDLFSYVAMCSTLVNRRYPYYGFQGFADEIANKFRKLGGKLITNSEVTRIIFENGKAVGVVTKGQIIQAKKIISAIDLKKVFLEFINNEYVNSEYAYKLQNVRLSDSFPVLYLGIDVDRDKIREYFNGSEHFVYVSKIKKMYSAINKQDYSSDENY